MPELSIYTVNCNHGSKVLLAGMGSSSRGTAYDVLACQEMGKDCSADNYARISEGKDTKYRINTGLFLREGNKKWQVKCVRTFRLPKLTTTRSVAMATLTSKANIKCEVFIATIHCKSGESFEKKAQGELGQLVEYILAFAKTADHKVVVITGDVNWASVEEEAQKREGKQIYKSKTHLGGDQMSGRSLMQTVVFYVENYVKKVDMKDLVLTRESHAIMETKISVAD